MGEERTFVDRRKGPDFLVSWVKYSSYVIWSLAVIVLTITSYAKPEFETFLDRMFNVTLRTTWDYNLLTVGFYFLVTLFFFSVASVVVHALRCRRKTDRIKKTLIAFSFLSFIVNIIYAVILYR